MTQITALQVNNLRKQTGAGMMDCKKALVETHGDFEKAIDVLRKKGQKVAAKRADRETSEGVVLALSNENNNVGGLISLNCETDFVAKNDNFVELAHSILTLALKNEALDIESIKWLEDYLKFTFKGSFLVISHNRSFLKNITNKVFWVDRKKISP